jgi:hypothetical protein
MIKGKVVPRLLTFNERNITKYINDMSEVGLITLYEVDGEKLLQYRKFNEFQKIVKDREARSLPSPEDGKILTTTSRPNPDKVSTKSEQHESNLIESNLIESKLRESEAPQPVDNSNGNRWTDETSNELDGLLKEIGERYGARYHQQCYIFIQTRFNQGNPSAILFCLKSLLTQRLAGKTINRPKEWLDKAFQDQDGKHNALDSERECNAHKIDPIEMSAMAMISGIGKSIPGGG